MTREKEGLIRSLPMTYYTDIINRKTDQNIDIFHWQLHVQGLPYCFLIYLNFIIISFIIICTFLHLFYKKQM